LAFITAKYMDYISDENNIETEVVEILFLEKLNDSVDSNPLIMMKSQVLLKRFSFKMALQRD